MTSRGFIAGRIGNQIGKSISVNFLILIFWVTYLDPIGNVLVVDVSLTVLERRIRNLEVQIESVEIDIEKKVLEIANLVDALEVFVFHWDRILTTWATKEIGIYADKVF